MENPKFDQFELDIQKTLDTYAEEAYEKKFPNATTWTSVLKERLGRLGEDKYGCYIATSGFPGEFEPEWLYDMVWYKEDDAKRLTEIPLVVECEWSLSFGQIKYDFEKLLLANADHRLMICYVYKDNLEKTLDYFREAIASYKHGRSGDRFMIAILDWDSEEFIYKLLIKS